MIILLIMNDEELKNAIKQSIHEVVSKPYISAKKKDFFDYAQIFAMPLIIALVSVLASLWLNIKTNEIAGKFREIEFERAQRMKEAELERADINVKAQLNLQRLSYIQQIFGKIVEESAQLQEDKIADFISQTISQTETLVAYHDAALPFLLKIKDHFKSTENDRTFDKSHCPDGGGKTYDKSDIRLIACAAENTIENILSGSQLDFRKIRFTGDKKMTRILRFANFENYNLSDAEFLNCNLFKANFKKSTLVGSRFGKVDLQSADFSNANLIEARFNHANLKRTNFVGAKLDGVRFREIENLNEAKFSLGFLLNAGPLAFSDIKNETDLMLLSRYADELEKRGENNADVQKQMAKFNLSFKDFISELRKYQPDRKE